ncbi:MAG: hypothetical protein NXH75_02190 [Halobacteriovoraceae bacterium]|nr:hypothetical protein [Halobacteriovoraceae bacterium]
MKKIMGLIALLSILVSCTSGVSDGVKSVALGKALMGGKVKLPNTPKASDIETFKALSHIIKVEVEKSEEVTEGKWKVLGTIKTDDTQKIQGVFMGLAFSSKGKGETQAQQIERAIASVEKKISNSKGYTAKPMAAKFELEYKVEDGKETVTSFKKIN